MGGQLGLTGQDVAFLLIGMLVGIGLGAAVTSVLRSRGTPTPAVRVTVTPAAIPRRAATLAQTDPHAPARGGPADPWLQVPAGAPPRQGTPARTPVPSEARAPRRAARGPALAFASVGAGATTRLVPVPMGGLGKAVDPIIGALRGSRSGSGARATTVLAPETVAATAAADEPADGGPAEPALPAAPRPADDGPCAELRTVAEERCEVAARARVEAGRAQDTLRAAQRSYDEHLTRAEELARAADPRSVRTAKDEAQRTFRAARSAASDAESVDAAARDWLLEINRINQEARAAAAAAARDQEAARQLAGSLDRLTVEADAARIAADSADEACLAARQAAADCEEAAADVPASMPAMPSGAPSNLWVDDPSITDQPAGALATGSAPTIFRLLQGDRVSMVSVVERLAGNDPEQRRAWQLAVSNLVDAILATAIEGSALDFPEEHQFWGPFTQAQSREIVSALSSLGYRFDGLGGWQDGRVPSQRDLSLALGYAGLDPMRMRHWPSESEMLELFAEVRVSAAEYLASNAGDLTLGELVTMLGPRAEALADVWNGWGRIRPLLLEER